MPPRTTRRTTAAAAAANVAAAAAAALAMAAEMDTGMESAGEELDIKAEDEDEAEAEASQDGGEDSESVCSSSLYISHTDVQLLIRQKTKKKKTFQQPNLPHRLSQHSKLL